MTMITPSYLGETIEYSSLHACRSTLEDPTLLVAPLRRIIAQKDALAKSRSRRRTAAASDSPAGEYNAPGACADPEPGCIGECLHGGNIDDMADASG